MSVYLKRANYSKEGRKASLRRQQHSTGHGGTSWARGQTSRRRKREKREKKPKEGRQ